MKKEPGKKILRIAVIVAVFWVLDFLMHSHGVGESNYYYLSKLANSILFAFIWILIFDYKEHWKKLAFSAVFGTWISFYYLVSSYSGFVQMLGVDARYTPPPFVVFGVFLSPYLWWAFHVLAFYLGTEISSLIKTKKK